MGAGPSLCPRFLADCRAQPSVPVPDVNIRIPLYPTDQFSVDTWDEAAAVPVFGAAPGSLGAPQARLGAAWDGFPATEGGMGWSLVSSLTQKSIIPIPRSHHFLIIPSFLLFLGEERRLWEPFSLQQQILPQSYRSRGQTLCVFISARLHSCHHRP